MIVTDVFRRVKRRTGEIGVEIEVEGVNLPDQMEGWEVHRDDSLRGNAREYVLTSPCPRNQLGRHLKKFSDVLEHYNTRPLESKRAGVHVHINVQSLTMAQLISFICLYGIFEESLVRWCGDGRSGSLFCLRIKDAEYLSSWIEYCTENELWNNLPENDIRYAALNLTSLSKFGSLEFRALRGTTDVHVIHQWVNLLLCIKDYALNQVDNPLQILDNLSKEGGKRFATSVFGDLSRLIFNLDVSEKEIEQGCRGIQTIAYSFKMPKVKTKSFVSKTRRVENRPVEIENILANFRQIINQA